MAARGGKEGERATPDLSFLVKEHGERRGTNSGHKAPPFLPGPFLPRSPSPRGVGEGGIGRGKSWIDYTEERVL